MTSVALVEYYEDFLVCNCTPLVYSGAGKSAERKR